MPLSLDELQPFTLSLAKRPDEMSRQEAKEQFQEFLMKLPAFISYIEEILQNEGIDLSGRSEDVLSRAGEWLVRRGRLVRVASAPGSIFGNNEPQDDLSIPTKSACCYIGCLFGDRIVREVAGARWVLVTENKRDFDYHKPVVRPAVGHDQLDPLHVTMMFALGRLRRSRERGALGDVYAIWKNDFKMK